MSGNGWFLVGKVKDDVVLSCTGDGAEDGVCPAACLFFYIAVE